MNICNSIKKRYLIILTCISILFIGEQCENPVGKISLAPNPAKEYTELTIELNTKAIVEINIYDSMGNLSKIVDSAKECLAGENKVQIDLHDLASGSYIIRLVSGQMRQTVKLIISR